MRVTDGSDDRIEVNGRLDSDVVDPLRDAFKTLRERGFQVGDGEASVFVGEEAWQHLGGEYIAVTGVERGLMFYGSPVYRVGGDFPDCRVMVVSESAVTQMVDYKYSIDASIGDPTPTDESVGDPSPIDKQGFVTKESSVRAMRHPEAIEFVPEFEVNGFD